MMPKLTPMQALQTLFPREHGQERVAIVWRAIEQHAILMEAMLKIQNLPCESLVEYVQEADSIACEAKAKIENMEE